MYTELNGDANPKVENEFKPILCVIIYVTINTVLKLTLKKMQMQTLGVRRASHGDWTNRISFLH